MDQEISHGVIVYGNGHCWMARSLRRALDENGIRYEWRDVEDGEPRYKDDLRKLARGYLSVPTVVFPDGTVMVEPSASMVLNRLDPQPASPSLLSRLFKR